LARLPESLDVLRRREFRLLFGAQAVSVLGDRTVAVALAFAVLEIGGSAADVGLVLAAGVFPLVGSVLVGGVVADRASRRAVMVGADLVRVASQGTMAALLIAGAADVWMLALLAGVTGTATGFFDPASTGLLPELVPAAQLQPANALRSSAISAGDPRPARRRAVGRDRRSRLGDRGRRRDVRGQRGVPGAAAGPDARRGRHALVRRRPA
jgi:Na+/melibiose symporter-like transporter